MTFRSEVDALRAEKEALKKELELAQKATVPPRPPSPIWRILGNLLLLVTFMSLSIWGASASCHACARREADDAVVAEQARLARIEAHQAMLVEMRSRLPEGIDAELWLWCVDHCARYHRPGSDTYSEGIITDVSIDYSVRSNPATLINIEGPWVSRLTAPDEFANVVTFRIGNNGVSMHPYGAEPVVGSLASITRGGAGTRIEMIDRIMSEYERLRGPPD